MAAAASAEGPLAAERAVSDAAAAVQGTPSLVLAFASGLHPEIAARRLGAATRGAPLAGMTGSGAIGPDGALERGCVAIAFAPPVRVGIGLARHATRDLRAAGRSATSDALSRLDHRDGHRLLILMLDTRTGDQVEAVAGAYELSGPHVPIVGGAAGGAQPAQLIAGEATRECVLAVALAAPGPIGIGSANGCRTPDDAVAGSRIAVGRALEALEGRKPRAALLFDGGGRTRALAARPGHDVSAGHEVSALLHAFSGALPPLAGLFTRGEVARTRGAEGALNQAVVAVAFA